MIQICCWVLDIKYWCYAYLSNYGMIQVMRSELFSVMSTTVIYETVLTD